MTIGCAPLLLRKPCLNVTLRPLVRDETGFGIDFRFMVKFRTFNRRYGGRQSMRMEDIREMAKALGVKAARMKKTELIRAVQIAEGNFPCFATASDYCDQLGCAFREDCLGPLQGREGEA